MRDKNLKLYARIPIVFRADTMSITLINRRPSVPIGYKFLEEEWQKKEISISYLKVFGFNAFFKVKDIEKDKLESKAKKCVFISYGPDDMGYRCWDDQTMKVIRNRDVTFTNDALYQDDLATTLSKINQSQKAVFAEFTYADVLQSEIGEGSKNSGGAEEIVNTEARRSSEEYKDS